LPRPTGNRAGRDTGHSRRSVRQSDRALAAGGALTAPARTLSAVERVAVPAANGEVEMEVVGVVGHARPEDRGERAARIAADLGEETALARVGIGGMDVQPGAVGELERGDVDGASESMLGKLRRGIVVHAPACIGRSDTKARDVLAEQPP